MSPLADEITDNLKTQPLWIVNDTRTYQWLRLNKLRLIDKNQLGGGNLLSILGLFAVLNYISKVYKILKTGKMPKTNKNDNKSTFTEDRAFKSLIRDSDTSIVSAQDKRDYDKKLGEIWLIYKLPTTLRSGF